jgi:hypothetical protein
MGAYPQQSPYGHYEFTHEENGVVEDCAKWGTALAIVYFVVGGFSIFSLCSSPLQASINIITYILVGVFIIMAAKSLKLVVNTQGNDIAHMMEALDKLGTMFLIRLIAVAISILLTILVLTFQAIKIASALS